MVILYERQKHSVGVLVVNGIYQDAICLRKAFNFSRIRV